MVAPPLEDTLIQVFQDGVEVLEHSETMERSRPRKWRIEEEEEIADGALLYGRFCIDGIPPRQGGTVGNTLRRTLLRQDLFRAYAAVAFRLRYRSYNVDQGKVHVSRAQPALHEFSSVPGVQESMIDVVRSVQQLTVARAPWQAPSDLPLSAMASEHPGEPDVWRWATRRCGPCPVKAQDLDMVDSSSFYERPTYLPIGQQHLLQISAPAMIEFEVEATCASQTEWEISGAFEEYRQRLRSDRWLVVPPLFSPVKKVNYMVTGSDDDTERLVLEFSHACTQVQQPVSSAPQESVQLEVPGTNGRPKEASAEVAPMATVLRRGSLLLLIRRYEVLSFSANLRRRGVVWVPLAWPWPALATELEGARERVAAVAQKLEELANTETFAKVAAGGGDNIRRELGTVGTTSPLFDAEKAFKALAEEVEDPELYFETLEKLKEAVSNADADAYSSIFSMNSAAATPPQVYTDRSFKEVQDARSAVRQLLAMLKKPSSLVRTSAASLLASLVGRRLEAACLSHRTVKGDADAEAPS
ncbi:rpoA, partial [Symbiodinium sp. CCMP2456]